LALPLREKVGVEIDPHDFVPTAPFLKAPPDSMIQENRSKPTRLVKSSGASFGGRLDADADRCILLRVGVFGAYITALLADILLEKKGSDNRSSLTRA